MDGVHDNGETEGLDQRRFDTAGVVGDIVVDQGGVFVGVTAPNWGEVVCDERPYTGKKIVRFV